MRLPDMESKEYGFAGCRFAGRCPYVRDICRQTRPPWVDAGTTHNVEHDALCFKLVDYQNVERQPEVAVA